MPDLRSFQPTSKQFGKRPIHGVDGGSKRPPGLNPFY
jgi:hypothetical protein